MFKVMLNEKLIKIAQFSSPFRSCCIYKGDHTQSELHQLSHVRYGSQYDTGWTRSYPCSYHHWNNPHSADVRLVVIAQCILVLHSNGQIKTAEDPGENLFMKRTKTSVCQKYALVVVYTSHLWYIRFPVDVSHVILCNPRKQLDAELTLD